MKIVYQKIKKYKYKIVEDLVLSTKITGYDVQHEFFSLSKEGTLVVKKGYLFDGVSGPMIDTDDSMIGGCGHDAGYQMIRLGLIPLSTKPLWDDLLASLFKACKMCGARVWYAHKAVDTFGGSSCIVGDVHIPKVITLEC